MRNIRARRRFKAILVLLLVITSVVFFENRIEAFAPQFRSLAELKVAEAFGKNVDISIGRLDGGIIRPFALRDVGITGKDAKGSPGIIEINSIISNYRIWNFIFPKILSSEPCIAVDFSTKSRELSGFLMLEGSARNASINGHVRLFTGEKIAITGKLSNGVARLVLIPGSGLVKVEGNFAADGVLLVRVVFGHVKLNAMDVSGEVIIKNIAVKNTIDGQDNSNEGEIELKNMILNYKPFLDGKASYRISKDILEISELVLGKSLCVRGRLGLKEPHLIDAVVQTDNMNLEELLSPFSARHGSLINGTMNSKWEFKGTAENLKSKIHLEIRKGGINELKFEFLTVDLKGDGPVMRIEDSRITRESGSFTIAGEMDTRKIGRDSFFESMKIAEGENTVFWDGYETSKWQDISEFKMSKKITEDFDIGFNKFINDGKIDESMRDRDEVEFSYKLHPTDSIKLRISNSTNFFGLEHKDKF